MTLSHLNMMPPSSSHQESPMSVTSNVGNYEILSISQ